jgi:hypothetical protein
MNWQRIEAATIDPDLDQGLEARIADPYWLLARQWQTGEFGGEDAANPLFMSIRGRYVPLDSVRIGGRPIDPATALDAPLEPVVEREPVRGGPAGARVAAELGQMLLRGLAAAQVPVKWRNDLRTAYPVSLPPDDELDPQGRRRLELLARLSLDGVAAAAAVAPNAVLSTLPALTAAPQALRTKFDAVGRAWLPIARGAFSEPGAQRAWAPSRMEYRFSVGATTASGPLELSADGYGGGQLEWYHFDWRSGTGFAEKELGESHSAELLPTPLRFRGMPASRFWEFENSDVYFGGVDAAPEDLARLAVAGYATLYGDDWYLIPIRLQAGTLAQVEELVVIDDYGRETPVTATAVHDGAGRAFRFFEITGDPGPARGAAPLLLIPPTVETTDAARPLEDVRFLRDEAANLAWAVEDRVESVTGRAVDLAARAGAPASAGATGDRWRYAVATAVPENWVPLVPVRIGGDTGPIAFQRGRVGTGEGTRGARGRVLEPRVRLLINEEEIPREGARVVRRFQSARGADGRLHVWVGRQKGPGRGQGSSSLEFDTIDRGV